MKVFKQTCYREMICRVFRKGVDRLFQCRPATTFSTSNQAASPARCLPVLTLWKLQSIQNSVTVTACLFFYLSFLEKRAWILFEYRPHEVTYRRQAHRRMCCTTSHDVTVQRVAFRYFIVDSPRFKSCHRVRLS